MVAVLVKPDYKEIPLANSDLFTLVDKQDYNYLIQWEWKCVNWMGQKCLAMRHSLPHHKYFLHREVANLFADDIYAVGHKNGNSLDNQRDNLQLKTHRRNPIRKATGLELSKREKQIALLIRDGLTDAQIANHLYIQKSTVSAHLRHIFEKFGIGKRTQIPLALRQYEEESFYPRLPPLRGKLASISKLKSQRLLTAQLVTKSMDAIALQISQLQQIHADLKQTLKVMEP